MSVLAYLIFLIQDQIQKLRSIIEKIRFQEGYFEKTVIIDIYNNFNTLGKELDNINSDIDITISGVVKDKKEKDKYTQYIIDGYLINDYKRKYDIKIGQIVKVEGNLKDLDKLGFDDFDYGRYIKSCGYKGLINSNYFKVIGKNKFYTYIGKFKI